MGAGQRVAVEGLAEIREVAVVGATEGAAIGSGRRDDDGARIAQDIDESAGITGRDDDHPPFYARVAQRVGEVIGREVDERELGIGDRDRRRIRRAVRGNRQKQHVAIEFHGGRQTLQRIVEPGHARQRTAVEITFVIDEGDLTLTGRIALADHPRRQRDLAGEHLLLTHAGKTQEKVLRTRRCIAAHRPERLVDPLRLLEQRALASRQLIIRERLDIPRIPQVGNRIHGDARGDERGDECRPGHRRDALRGPRQPAQPAHEIDHRIEHGQETAAPEPSRVCPLRADPHPQQGQGHEAGRQNERRAERRRRV